MDINEILNAYNQDVGKWLDLAKKTTAAVQKLQKAVDAGTSAIWSDCDRPL